MSTLTVSNFSDGTSSVPASAVIEGTAKAAFQYDQRGPSVVSEYNISSISDDATGEFTSNYTNAFASYETQKISGMNMLAGTGRVINVANTSTASAVGYRTVGNNATTDSDQISGVMVLGDLA